MDEKKKKKFKMPHTYVILATVILIVAVCNIHHAGRPNMTV